MCLDSVDKVMKKHRIGYKIFRRDPETSKLKSPYIGHLVYPLKKWISDNRKGIINGQFSEFEYETGFHYYLYQKDAIKVCELTIPEGIVYRIFVRKKICTGHQIIKTSYPVGVAKEIFIIKRITKNIDRRKIVVRRYKELVNALKVKEIATSAEKIYEAQGKGLDLKDLYQKYFEVVTKDLNTYCEWISFVDHFSRRSIRFHSQTMFHSYALIHFPKHAEYYNIVSRKHKFIDQPHIDCISKEIDY